MKWIRVLVLWMVGSSAAMNLSAVEMADSVKIYGYSSEYKGQILIIETLSNYISRDKVELGRFKVGQNGYFSASFFIDQPIKCFLDLGKYRAFIYTEPGKDYQVILPPYAPRMEADKFNPFYEPEEVILGIVNVSKGSLNELIRDFDERFLEVFNQNALLIFSQGDVAKANQIKEMLENQFPSDKDSYFDLHKSFRYARLYSLAYKRQKRTIIDRYYSHKPVEFMMPAYWEAYSEVFKDFFSYYFSTTNGRKLRLAIITNQRFDTLSLVMSADTLFTQPDLRESVLLKSLYDSYYNGKFSQDLVLDLVQQATTLGTTPKICLLATQILWRMNRLRVGTDAPDFEGITIGGKKFNLSDYQGKFLYLNFIHTDNYACKKDLQVLSQLAKEFHKELEVVTILVNENMEDGFSYFAQNGYKWDILHYNGNDKVLMNYNVKALPVYYLIDPDKKLVLSPAPAPEENFRNFFIDAIRNFKYKKERKLPDRQRSIYDI